jgi:integrase
MAERQSWLADLSRQFKRHRQGRPGWFLRVKRDHLQLLSSELPPRPGERDGAPAQRALLLSTPPGPSTAAAALAEACLIFDAVMAGTWQWPDPLAPSAGDPGHLRPSVLARMRERLRVAVVGEQVSERTWDNTYVPYLRALERMAGEQQEWPDDLTFLATTLRRWPSNSRGRQMAYDRFRRLWKEADWPWPDGLASMRGTGKAVAHPDGVTAFTDQEIERLREQIKTSQLTAADLVAWDCLIVFGLRPAELQGLKVEQQGRLLVATVQREKKTGRYSVGRRAVPAVPPKGWPSDCYGLLLRWQEHGLPAAVVNAESPGEVMARQLRRFRNKGAFRKELKPYSLRHLFAIRLNTDLGLQVREAAELMGHSPAVHLSTYGRRLDQPKLLEKVAGLQGLD